MLPRADGMRGFRLDDGTDTDGNPRTDRLGISCSQVSKDRAEELGLESGVGLEVMDVAPGSIAGVLGLRQGDVVTEINGTTIRSADDVKKVLADRAKDGEVAVVVQGEDGDRRTLTWKPKAADKKSADASEKSSSAKRGSRDL
jgi:serine protease Do